MEMEFGLFWITTFVSVLMVVLVLQNTYLYLRIRSSRASLAYLILQGLLLLWAIMRLAEAYAPTPDTLANNCLLQILFIALILLFYIFLLWNPAKILHGSRQIILSAIVLVGLLIITDLSGYKTFLYYTIPVISAEVLTLFMWFHIRSARFGFTELSLKSVIQSMGDCILVLDLKHRIMDANLAFFEPVFGQKKPWTYMDFCRQLSIEEIVSEKERQILSDLLNAEGEQEINFLINTHALTCTCKTVLLHNAKGDRIGLMISFHNITAHSQLRQELEDKKQELITINNELQDFILVVNRLEEEKVKREISLRIQNSIGQEIMELLTMLEVAKLKTDSTSVHELELAVEACRKLIGRIRESVAEIEKG